MSVRIYVDSCLGTCTVKGLRRSLRWDDIPQCPHAEVLQKSRPRHQGKGTNGGGFEKGPFFFAPGGRRDRIDDISSLDLCQYILLFFCLKSTLRIDIEMESVEINRYRIYTRKPSKNYISVCFKPSLDFL